MSAEMVLNMPPSRIDSEKHVGPSTWKIITYFNCLRCTRSQVEEKQQKATNY